LSGEREIHRSAGSQFVAMLTAAAHAFGKPLVLQLANAGADVAITSLARLASRTKLVEERGGRAVALRMNVNDPLSVRLALETIRSELGPVDLLVPVAPHELAAASCGVDPCTEAVASQMQGRGGAVIYLLGAADVFPEQEARAWAGRKVFFVGLRVDASERPSTVAEAVVSAFQGSRRFAASVRGVAEVVAG
jgi:hypothetical protein